ncbi:glutamate N-acetyltransferase [Hydrogenoanaerobacterium saccharovorans]|uniref:Arginine biosynthesis bifunctional protein ArgJ n=1 Tax=Hydrogenoanaerobacterium saccharovorans TaxID=474960 RepID=A0A1H8BSR0_9FIRM|nr:bifunctional glutamate N-acetyltransferase/amino-acid acetyltransferase ArgJ [Hydrogenoanaerobacterium saccharovorans]RPF47264.1 glutamate N-acetyltransferase [Hydrogenoanaerobacterium saccharovorans]SEM85619.1 glutamate N-acetyltransferase [Hydrogenoanaerobacterium saccharovorans]
MNIQPIGGGVCAPQGFAAGGIHCGIRKNKTKRDLALIYSKTPCAVACTYTQNKVKGAPITVTMQNVADDTAKAIICNSGNANTCNANGIEIATQMCELTGKALGIAPADVVVASTGVIGQPLSIEPIAQGMQQLVQSLSTQGSSDACEGIMTTDTFKKEFAISFTVDGVPCKMGAIAKGSGMIHPNMATMLAFVTTDVAIVPALLQKAVWSVVSDTFNMVSVDGDTSTNDMFTCLANGEANNPVISSADSTAYQEFCAALYHICTLVSKNIAKDGEGATKLLECTVTGASDKAIAKKVAKSVICSSLFKAAMFGSDANWGRVLCAIGYTDAEFDITKVDVSFASQAGSIAVCKNGAGMEFSEDKAKQILTQDTIQITIDMNDGAGSATAWGCDLTYDYVKINGDYRT